MIERRVYEVHNFYQDLLNRVLDSNSKCRKARASVKKEMLYRAQVAGHNYMRALEASDARKQAELQAEKIVEISSES